MNNAYIRAQQCKVKEAKFPFVKIGTQYWTTKNLSLSVTPQGNTIPEMQANGNVEKITNTSINTSADWTMANNVTLNSNKFIFNGSNCNLYVGIANASTSNGKIYKLSLSVSGYVSGSISLILGAGGGPTFTVSANGAYTFYSAWKGSNSALQYFGTANLSIGGFSAQEIGWSGSQELYDGIYAQTSGTVEQKTYAAVKAAAMWSNYNNDAVLGGIYGKLYNWFAVKLFQMDIDYYNAANPSKPYIWRMPTQAEFQTLSNFLGGDAVSGGHLKEAGLAHWLTPNTGSDNSSGFCALGSGYIASIFGGLKSECSISTIDSITTTLCLKVKLRYDNSIIILTNETKATGLAIRLIKA